MAGDDGCGLYFCAKHLGFVNRDCHQLCPRCANSKPPYKRVKAEHPTWIEHKLSDPSWADWRAANPKETEALRSL